MQLKATNNNSKVLFYCGGFAPVGGIETFGKNLLIYLQSKGFDCTLLCWGQFSPLLEVIQQEQVKIVRIPWRWGCNLNLPDWILLPWGIEEIKKADIVILGKLFPLKILQKMRLAANKNTKFVYITAHRHLLPENLTQRNILRETLNLFDMILVQSSTFVQDLQDIAYQGIIEVIPLIPQESKRLEALPMYSEIKIGFLGRLVKEKNVHLLLESFQYLQSLYNPKFQKNTDNNSRVSLHIFGDGYQRQELEKFAEKLGVRDDVIFHGNVPNHQVGDAIAECHLFAFTSRSEGQCLAALEILAGGRPIIATNVGAFSEILSDSRLGKLVEFANAENYAYGLLDIINLIHKQVISPEVIRSTYLERYDAEKLGDRYIKIINSLCIPVCQK
ncbi:glycosyltransferase [Calothrix sp. UHCC 0171]|uniref:glycosyltransferase n=1 Tax=Calothrix sp. UHCC 0171 TaxID=3110245 RepID=UPI002B20BDBD|nr:glycosyltransferase [Calothrix sp. UHCC 0171]MEA5570391.1 glycosyltransferase [Calothrix sp. UHCC 0171]